MFGVKKLTIENYRDDFKILTEYKRNTINEIKADIKRFKQFHKIVRIIGSTDSYDKDLFISSYPDFPQKECMDLVFKFLNTKFENAENEFNQKLEEFKEKYKDIGLDISEDIKSLENMED